MCIIYIYIHTYTHIHISTYTRWPNVNGTGVVGPRAEHLGGGYIGIHRDTCAYIYIYIYIYIFMYGRARHRVFNSVLRCWGFESRLHLMNESLGGVNPSLERKQTNICLERSYDRTSAGREARGQSCEAKRRARPASGARYQRVHTYLGAASFHVALRYICCVML